MAMVIWAYGYMVSQSIPLSTAYQVRYRPSHRAETLRLLLCSFYNGYMHPLAVRSVVSSPLCRPVLYAHDVIVHKLSSSDAVFTRTGNG